MAWLIKQNKVFQDFLKYIILTDSNYAQIVRQILRIKLNAILIELSSTRRLKPLFQQKTE